MKELTSGVDWIISHFSWKFLKIILLIDVIETNSSCSESTAMYFIQNFIRVYCDVKYKSRLFGQTAINALDLVAKCMIKNRECLAEVFAL